MKAKALTIADLSKKHSEKVEFVWRQHYPKGMPILFDGREGTGKTTLCLASAHEILKAHERGTVLWIPTEGIVHDTFSKAKDMGIKTSRFRVMQSIHNDYDFDFSIAEHMGSLDWLLSDLPKPILSVFIDSVGSMCPLDDNDSRIKVPMKHLNGIVCETYGASLVFVDHHRKGKAELRDKNIGSTKKRALARVALSVIEDSSSKRVRIIKISKNNLLQDIPDLRAFFYRGQITFREIGRKENLVEETEVDRAEDFLIGLFKETGMLQAAEVKNLAEAAGISQWSLTKAKEKLGITGSKDGNRGPWYWIFPH